MVFWSRHAVGKLPEPKTLDLKASAFDPKEKIWTRFPPEGTKQTPPHQSCDFKWKDYCPLVFRLAPCFSFFFHWFNIMFYLPYHAFKF